MRIMFAAALVAAVALAAPALAEEPAEQIVNGTFDTGTAPWWGTGNSRRSSRRRPLCADVPGGTVNPWDAIIGQDDVPLSRARRTSSRSSPRPPRRASSGP